MGHWMGMENWVGRVFALAAAAQHAGFYGI